MVDKTLKIGYILIGLINCLLAIADITLMIKQLPVAVNKTFGAFFFLTTFAAFGLPAYYWFLSMFSENLEYKRKFY